MEDAPAPTRLLLVEGVDDKHVVRHVWARKNPGKPQPFEIREKDGVERLVESISVEVKVPGRIALGIMVDANSRVESRWRSMERQLRIADVDLPSDMDRDGTIIDDAGLGVTVGVWIMPDNMAQGHLEDFVAGLIPEEDPVWPLAREYIHRIPEDHRPKDVSKAALHAWLAARAEPRRMGQAIGFGDLQLTGIADRFACWLRRLFE